jgi:transcription antitermination factor NusG
VGIFGTPLLKMATKWCSDVLHVLHCVYPAIGRIIHLKGKTQMAQAQAHQMGPRKASRDNQRQNNEIIQDTVEKILQLPAESALAVASAVQKHLHAQKRKDMTIASLKSDISSGDKVTVKTGPYTGKIGIVEESRNTRCLVRVDGRDNALYIHRSEVEKVAE